MAKIVISMVIGVLLVFSPSVSALELTGEHWMLFNQESSADHELTSIQRGELGLISLGPIRVLNEIQFAGSLDDLGNLMNLLQKQGPQGADSTYALAELTTRVRVDWPLPGGTSVIGSVGYRISGYMYDDDATADDWEYGLYQGLTYAGGLGVELMRGLRAYGIVEIGPSLVEGYPNSGDSTVNWTGYDVGVEYRIPFFKAKAGYRLQEMDGSKYNHKMSGFFVGAGFHF